MAGFADSVYAVTPYGGDGGGASSADLTLAGSVGAVTGSFTVTALARMDLSGSVPAVTGSFTATVLARMDLAGSVPQPTGAFTLAFEDQILSLAGAVPRPTGAFTVTVLERMDLAGAVPGVAGAFSMFPREDVTLSGAVAGVTGSFTLEGAADLAMSLAGSVGRVRGSFVVDTGSVGADTSDRSTGLSLSGSMLLEFDPVVDPVPANRRAAISRQRITAHAWASVSRDGTEYAYTGLDTAGKKRLRERVVIGGRDVTYFRGAEVKVTRQLVSPLLYGPGSASFPQINAAYEQVGSGALSWLDKGRNVRVDLVDEDDVVVERGIYKGLVTTWEPSGTDLNVQIGGEASGRAALQWKPLPVYDEARSSAGKRAYGLIRSLGLEFNPFQGPESPNQRVAKLGGMYVIDAIEFLCRSTQRRDGTQFSIMPGDGGAYRFEAKDTTTVHATVYVDGSRVVANVRSDMVDEPTEIFADAVTEDGKRLTGIQSPGIVQGKPIEFDGNMSLGDTGGQVPVLVDRLQGFELLDVKEGREGFDEDVQEAVEDLQEAAGLAVTGVVNEATWNALHDLDVTELSLRLAHREPAARQPRTARFRTTPTGARIRKNPNYDPSVVKVSQHLDMGAGVSFRQRKRWAKAELTGPNSVSWSGTLEINTGAVIAGNHHFGDPLATGDLMDVRLLKPGMNIMARGFQDEAGTLFHIAGIDGDGKTLLVDTRARDTLHVWDAIQRRRDENRWSRGRRASGELKDSVGEWDGAGGGMIRTAVDLKGGEWNIYAVPAGDEGTISRIRRATNPNAESCTVLFGGPLVPAAIKNYLDRKIPNPLTEGGTDAFSDHDINQKLKDNGLLGVWGEHLDPGGYHPRAKSRGGELTGVLADDAGIAYRTDRFPVLYVADWVDRDCTVPAGRIMWNQLEPGA